MKRQMLQREERKNVWKHCAGKCSNCRTLSETLDLVLASLLHTFTLLKLRCHVYKCKCFNVQN